MRSSLLLNADYAPMSIIPATRAVTMIVAGEAVSLDDSPIVFRSQSLTVPVPYVLLSKKYTKRKNNTRKAKFSRRGVLVRDNHTCAYCGKYADTIDHVIPRKEGGLSTYDNCVAACVGCNRKKGHKTLKQMNWTVPSNQVKAPSLFATMLNKATSHDEQFHAWSPYILAFEPELAKSLSFADKFQNVN